MENSNLNPLSWEVNGFRGYYLPPSNLGGSSITSLALTSGMFSLPEQKKKNESNALIKKSSIKKYRNDDWHKRYYL